MVAWIEDYDERTVDEVRAAVDERDPPRAQLEELLEYERGHQDRVTVTDYLESRLEAAGDGEPADDGVEPDRVDGVDPGIEDRVEAVESAFGEKLRDVRERVIQVKRETDAKAPLDHDHPEIESRLDRIVDAVEGLDADLDDLEESTTTGFRNYEAVLEYLTETVDELEGKLDRLAAATLELREGLDMMREAHARRAAVEQLASDAVRHGTRTAECESCGESVPIAMLSTPRCPHCAETFSEFSPKRGLLDSHVLLTGTHPALEPARSGPRTPGRGTGPSIDDVVGDRVGGDDGDDAGVDGDGEVEAEDLLDRDG